MVFFRFVLSENGKIKCCFFPCQGAILAAVASRKCPSKIIREYFMTFVVHSHHKLYDVEVEFKCVRTLYDAYLKCILHFWIYRLRSLQTPDFVLAPSKAQDSRLLVKFLDSRTVDSHRASYSDHEIMPHKKRTSLLARMSRKMGKTWLGQGKAILFTLCLEPNWRVEKICIERVSTKFMVCYILNCCNLCCFFQWQMEMSLGHR